MELKFLEYIIFFIIGFLCSFFLSMYSNIEMPLGLNLNRNADTPSDWINENQIHVYENAIVIDIEDASISKYAPTGSMIPVLDENSNGIRIIPESENDINVGDIITFEQDSQLIVHRVIEKGSDEEGVYFITKGDNSNITDGKIRFKNIKYVTIGILW